MAQTDELSRIWAVRKVGREQNRRLTGLVSERLLRRLHDHWNGQYKVTLYIRSWEGFPSGQETRHNYVETLVRYWKRLKRLWHSIHNLSLTL